MGDCYACGAVTQRRRIGIADLDVCGECGFGRLVEAAPTVDYWARNHDPEHELEERYWDARVGVYRRALDEAGGQRRDGPGLAGRGTAVDLGGGVGLFAACALELGWDAYSVDVSEHAAKAAAARIGAGRSLVSVPDELAGSCDLVTLWCVIAHVPDPRAVLAEARRLVAPSGRLLLTTPNFLFQARFARLAARLGRPLDFAGSDHLLHFTPAALDRVLASVGLRRRRFAYWGSTEDCLFERRLARLLVPPKRLWNWGAWQLSRLGAQPWYSELQVEAVPASPGPPERA